MKRALLITVLLLMIMTSLNAGTLAIYTSTIDLTAPITAKRFALGVNGGRAEEFDLLINPGDTVSYNFIISNTDSEGRTSEVAMDLLIESDFSSVVSTLPGIQIHLMHQHQTLRSINSAGRLSYSESKAFSAAMPGQKQFSLVFTWPDTEAAQAALMAGGVSLPLSIYIRGTQHV